ncbi:hypothetical protein SAMD00019534_000550 [Acytostelium subglobosum LB1]|uniref:hypothetical protein n=1 Tax=Acytostelium subglobosum LB1 TaxID=1410327 RepID=UPI0006448AC9|nr:hypothetical protein SAMD00019534_000550 [Acytostelium subglobosum LB1]GAM16880.1 hypothetical protein SAMD00019534_000550 [Acytostelium subglobosum LB1]|eukprot:XP_012758942.1 hypothetical protein SAMD00019534_000550 [Acytostelium subglobosum LB1]
MTPFGEITGEIVDEPREIKQMEKSMVETRALLTDLIKTCKEAQKKGLSMVASAEEWGQSLPKDYEKIVSSTQKSKQIGKQHQYSQSDVETRVGFEKAMEQFSQSTAKTMEFEKEFGECVVESFIKPVQVIVNRIDERKTHRKKYDKAYMEYDSLLSKIRHQQSQKKIDILKLYTYERDKNKACANYNTAKADYLGFLRSTLDLMHTEFVNLLASHFDAIYKLGQDATQEFVNIQAYIESLQSWCLSEKECHVQDIHELNQQYNDDVEQDIIDKYMPLVELLTEEPFGLWAHMAEVRRTERYPVPPMIGVPGPLPPPPVSATPIVNFIPPLVRLVDSAGHLSEFLTALVVRDMPNVSMSMAMMFPHNPMACELVEEIARHIATPYLRHLFEPTINQIVNYPEHYDPLTPEGLEALVREFNSTMEAFKDSAQYLPPIFKKASLEIQKQFAAKTSLPAYPPIGCLLFGRVFTPALARPHLSNLCNTIPSSTSLEALHFLSTMVYNAGSNQIFLRGPQHVNDAVAKWKPMIRDFFQEVFANKEDMAVEWEPKQALRTTFATEVITIQSFLKQHYQTIASAMCTKGEKELCQQFVVALGLLEAEDATNSGIILQSLDGFVHA